MVCGQIDKDSGTARMDGIDQFVELVHWRCGGVEFGQCGIDRQEIGSGEGGAVAAHAGEGCRAWVDGQQLHDAEAFFQQDRIQMPDQGSEGSALWDNGKVFLVELFHRFGIGACGFARGIGSELARKGAVDGAPAASPCRLDLDADV